MAGLGRRAAPGDRFSHWTPLAAMLVMALTLLLLVAAALSDRTGGQENEAAVPSPAAGTGQPATETDGRDTDLLLYDRIAERVAAGDSYYRAAVEEQRAGNFPVSPASTVRLPTLALLNAWLGHGGGQRWYR